MTPEWQSPDTEPPQDPEWDYGDGSRRSIEVLGTAFIPETGRHAYATIILRSERDGPNLWREWQETTEGFRWYPDAWTLLPPPPKETP